MYDAPYGSKRIQRHAGMDPGFHRGDDRRWVRNRRSGSGEILP